MLRCGKWSQNYHNHLVRDQGNHRPKSAGRVQTTSRYITFAGIVVAVNIFPKIPQTVKIPSRVPKQHRETGSVCCHGTGSSSSVNSSFTGHIYILSRRSQKLLVKLVLSTVYLINTVQDLWDTGVQVSSIFVHWYMFGRR